MRVITLLVIHCSAVKPDQTSSAAQIDTWHRKDRHYKFGIGYHYVIRRDGSIEPGRPEWMVGAHCLNHNAHSIGICYEGGLDIRGQPADTRTAEQKTAMRQLLEALRKRYPRALIVGHRDLSHDRDCPCFQCGERIRRPSAEIDHQKSLAISARLFISNFSGQFVHIFISTGL